MMRSWRRRAVVTIAASLALVGCAQVDGGEERVDASTTVPEVSTTTNDAGEAGGVEEPVPPPTTADRNELPPMVHQDGSQLIDENGQPLYLRGVNVEGWLTWPGHTWGGGFVSERQVRDYLEESVGQAAFAEFEQDIYNSFLTERDIELMADQGFNVVRVLFNHEILEGDDNPYVYKDSGWALLDELLDWGEQHGVYIVPCLISAPGGQSTWFLADPDSKLLWDDEENKKRTVALWQAIAERYSGRPIIAGYEVLNEPAPPRTEDLLDLYERIIAAIREVDPGHMVILDGTESSMNFSMFERPLDDNQMYSFHAYHLVLRRLIRDESAQRVNEMATLSMEQGVPIWASEFGANTLEWTEEMLGLFEEPSNGLSGWGFWPWKRGPSPNSETDYQHLAAIRPDDAWFRFIGNIDKWIAEDFTQEEALSAMKSFLEAMRAENLDFDPGMLELLGDH